jgi:hypothetical protein
VRSHAMNVAYLFASLSRKTALPVSSCIWEREAYEQPYPVVQESYDESELRGQRFFPQLLLDGELRRGGWKTVLHHWK